MSRLQWRDRSMSFLAIIFLLFNLSMSAASSNSTSSNHTSFVNSSINISVPGFFEFENFDAGTDGHSGHNSTSNFYRMNTSWTMEYGYSSKGHPVGLLLKKNMWALYTINVSTTARYSFYVRGCRKKSYSSAQYRQFFVMLTSESGEKATVQLNPAKFCTYFKYAWQEGHLSEFATIFLNASSDRFVNVSVAGYAAKDGAWLDYFDLQLEEQVVTTAASNDDTVVNGTINSDEYYHMIPGNISAEYFDSGSLYQAYRTPALLTAMLGNYTWNQTRSRSIVKIDSYKSRNFVTLSINEMVTYTVYINETGVFNFSVTAFGTTTSDKIVFGLLGRNASAQNIYSKIPKIYKQWKNGTVWANVSLTKGATILKVYCTLGKFYLGKMEFTLVRSLNESSNSSAMLDLYHTELPGVLEFENFINASDHTLDNEGNATSFRATQVDLQSAKNNISLIGIGWLYHNEYLDYSIHVTKAGLYYMHAKIFKTSKGGTDGIFLTLQKQGETVWYSVGNGIALNGNLPNKGLNYYPVAVFSLPAGNATLRLRMHDRSRSSISGWFLDCLKFELASEVFPDSSSSLSSLPGFLQLENFDRVLLPDYLKYHRTDNYAAEQSLNGTSYRNNTGAAVLQSQFVNESFYAVQGPATTTSGTTYKLYYASLLKGTSYRWYVNMYILKDTSLSSSTRWFSVEVGNRSYTYSNSLSYGDRTSYYSKAGLSTRKEAWLQVELGVFTFGSVPGYQMVQIQWNKGIYLDSISAARAYGPFGDQNQNIPGKIVFAHYDYSGWKDADSRNYGNLKTYREATDGVDLSYYLGMEELKQNTTQTGWIPSVTRVESNEELSYSVDVALGSSNGLYDIYFSGGAPVSLSSLTGLMYLKIDATIIGSPFSWQDSAGIANNVYIGTVNLSSKVIGKNKMLKIIFLSSSIGFVTSIEFVPTPSGRVATPYLPNNGRLMSEVVNVWEYDQGGFHVGYYSEHATSTLSGHVYPRSGDVFPLKTSSKLGTYGSMDSKDWVQYSFHVTTRRVVAIELRLMLFYRTGTTKFSFTFQQYSNATNIRQANYSVSNYDHDMYVPFFFNVLQSVELEANVQYRATISSMSSKAWGFFTMTLSTNLVSFISATPTSCLLPDSFPNVANCNIDSNVVSNTCKIPKVNFELGNYDNTTNLVRPCSFSDTGNEISLNAPGATGVKGVFLTLVEKSVTKSSLYKEPGTTFQVPSTWKGGRASVMFRENSVVVVQSDVFPARLLWNVYWAGDAKTIVFTESGTLEAYSETGATLFSRGEKEQFTTRQLVLQDCGLFIQHPPQKFTDPITKTVGWSPYVTVSTFVNKTCVSEINPVPLANKIEVVYTSSIAETVGYISSRPDEIVLPTGITHAFYDICYVGTLKMLFLPFTRTILWNETVQKIRFHNQEWPGRILIGGWTWYKQRSDCEIAVEVSSNDMDLASDIAFRSALRLSASSAPECSKACIYSSSCTAFSFFVERGKSLCFGSSTSSVSPSVAQLSQRRVIFGSKRVSDVTRLTSNTFQTSDFNLLQNSSFPISEGWESIVFSINLGSKIVVPILQLNAVALTAPSYHFQDKAAWIFLGAPNWAQQCGSAAKAFDDVDIFASTVRKDCVYPRMATCGAAQYGTSRWNTEVTVMVSASAAAGACDDRLFASLHYKGVLKATVQGQWYVWTTGSPSASQLSALRSSNVLLLESSRLTLLDFHDWATNSQRQSKGKFACVFPENPGFVAQPGYGGTIETCRSIAMFGVLIRECESSESCVGFTTKLIPSTNGKQNEVAGCMQQASTLIPKVNSVFYAKRRTVSSFCEFSVDDAYGALNMQVTQSGFGTPNAIMSVFVNGQQRFRCGGYEGFENGEAASGICGRVKTCYLAPLSVQLMDVVRIEISSAVASKGSCEYAAAALLTFDSTSSAAVVMPSTPHVKRLISMHHSQVEQAYRISTKFTSNVALILRHRLDYYMDRPSQRMNISFLTSKYDFLLSNKTKSSTTFVGDAPTFNFSFYCGGNKERIYYCREYSYCDGSSMGPHPTEFHEVDGYIELDVAPVTYSSVSLLSRCTVGSASYNANVGYLLIDGAPDITFIDRSRMRSMLLYEGFVDRFVREALATYHSVTANDVSVFMDSILYRYSNPISKMEVVSSFVAYDIPSWPEGRKNWELLTNNTMACIVDAYVDQKSRPNCVIYLHGANYVTVEVAQTHFFDANSKVTVMLGGRSVQCGGGNPFSGGYFGKSDRCDQFFTCYQGAVPNGATEIVIAFTPPKIQSSCFPAAVATAKMKIQPQTKLNCLNSTDLRARTEAAYQCLEAAQCLPPETICNGVIDCPGGGDETHCHNWKLVSRSLYPACPEKYILPPQPLIDFATCRNWAIAKSHLLDPSMSFMWVENQMCVAYTCLDPASPMDVLRNLEFAEEQTEFYVRMDGNFGMCSSELSCYGHGLVTSETPPCSCVCGDDWTGQFCELPVDMQVVDGVTIRVDQPDISATQANDIQRAVEDVLGTNEYAVEVEISSSPSESRVTIWLISFTATGTARQSAYLRLLEQGNQRKISQVLGGSSPSARRRLSNVSVAVKEMSTLTVFAINKTVECVIASAGCVLTLLAAEEYANVVALYISFPGLVVRSSDVFKLTWKGKTEFCDTVESVFDPLVEGPCAVSTICAMPTFWMPANREGIAEDIQVLIDRTKLGTDALAGCRQGLDSTYDETAVVAQITYTIIPLIKDQSATVDDTNIQVYSATRSWMSVGLILTLFGAFALILDIFFLVLMCATRDEVPAEKEGEKEQSGAGLETTFITLFFLVFIMMSSGIGVIISAKFISASHFLFVDEFRSSLCHNSPLSPIPHRVGRVVADGKCHRVEAIGSTEGTSYIWALCKEGGYSKKRFNGVIETGFGRSVTECEQSKISRVDQGSCYVESDLFVGKTEDEQQYVELRCVDEDDADARMRDVSNRDSRQHQPTDVATVRSLPAEATMIGALFAEGAPKLVYYVASRRYTVPVIRATPDSYSLVSYRPNDVIPDGIETDAVVYHAVDEATFGPRLGSATQPISDLGTIFNGFGSSIESSGIQTAIGAQRYQVVTHPVRFELDKIDRGEYTISFWMKASPKTRGFPFVIVDNWIEKETYESPIVERLLQIVENGMQEKHYFYNTWHSYGGMYVNGNSKVVKFVFSKPGLVTELVWHTGSLSTINPTSIDIFDNRWHFITLGVAYVNSRREASLFLDGESHRTEAGWLQCFPEDVNVPAITHLPNQVPVFNHLDELVAGGGVMYVGHLNAGLYNLQLHEEFMEHEKIVAMGAYGMERYIFVLVPQSLALGIFLVVFGAFFFVVSGIQFYKEYQETKEEEEKKKLQVVQDAKTYGSTTAKSGQEGAEAGAKGAEGLETVAAGGSNMKVIIPAFLDVCQRMDLFITGWRWPAKFTINIGWVISWFSFNINLNFPSVPSILSPILQFIIAIVTIVFILYLLMTDHSRFTEAARRKKKLREKLKKNNEIKDDGDEDRDEENEVKVDDVPQPLKVSRHSVDMDVVLEWKGGKAFTEVSGTSRHSLFFKEVQQGIDFLDIHKDDKSWSSAGLLALHNVKFEFWKPTCGSTTWTQVKFGDLRGYVVVRRKDELHYRIEFLSSIVATDRELIPRAVTLKQQDARMCPLHDVHLIQRVEEYHAKVRVKEKRPYICAYYQNRWYRRVCKDNDNIAPCEGLTDNYFVCPVDDCTFTVCSDCHQLGGAGKIRAMFSGQLWKYERMGALALVGIVMLLLAQAVYLPIVRSALMVIACHPVFQCVFPGCYNGGGVLYKMAVAWAGFILIFLGIGFIVFLWVTVANRKKTYMKEILGTLGLSSETFTGCPSCEASEWVLASMEDSKWAEALADDNSMLKAVYDQYEFRWMLIHPMLLVFKILVVLPIAFAEPNSLTQLVGASASECLFLLFNIGTSAYRNMWLDTLAKLGALHQVFQLSFMCFHRVFVFKDPSDDTMAYWMIIGAVIYLVFVIVVIAIVVVIPSIKAWKRKKEEEQKKSEEAIKAGSDAGSVIDGDDEGQTPDLSTTMKFTSLFDAGADVSDGEDENVTVVTDEEATKETMNKSKGIPGVSMVWFLQCLQQVSGYTLDDFVHENLRLPSLVREFAAQIHFDTTKSDCEALITQEITDDRFANASNHYWRIQEERSCGLHVCVMPHVEMEVDEYYGWGVDNLTIPQGIKVRKGERECKVQPLEDSTSASLSCLCCRSGETKLRSFEKMYSQELKSMNYFARHCRPWQQYKLYHTLFLSQGRKTMTSLEMRQLLQSKIIEPLNMQTNTFQLFLFSFDEVRSLYRDDTGKRPVDWEVVKMVLMGLSRAYHGLYDWTARKAHHWSEEKAAEKSVLALQKKLGRFNTLALFVDLLTRANKSNNKVPTEMDKLYFILNYFSQKKYFMGNGDVPSGLDSHPMDSSANISIHHQSFASNALVEVEKVQETLQLSGAIWKGHHGFLPGWEKSKITVAELMDLLSEGVSKGVFTLDTIVNDIRSSKLRLGNWVKSSFKNMEERDPPQFCLLPASFVPSYEGATRRKPNLQHALIGHDCFSFVGSTESLGRLYRKNNSVDFNMIKESVQWLLRPWCEKLLEQVWRYGTTVLKGKADEAKGEELLSAFFNLLPEIRNELFPRKNDFKNLVEVDNLEKTRFKNEALTTKKEGASDAMAAAFPFFDNSGSKYLLQIDKLAWYEEDPNRSADVGEGVFHLFIIGFGILPYHAMHINKVPEQQVMQCLQKQYLDKIKPILDKEGLEALEELPIIERISSAPASKNPQEEAVERMKSSAVEKKGNNQKGVEEEEEYFF